MEIKIYQVDAFTSKKFGGNPAAVCPLNEWLPDSLLQNIAMENNLSETAFFIKDKTGYSIRWFTPAAEVDLCGHATLATAHVVFNHMDFKEEKLEFQSRSGILTVKKSGNSFILNFPADKPEKINAPEHLIDALGRTPVEVFRGRSDYLFAYTSEKEIASIHPDFKKLAFEGVRGIMITAPGDNVDFVSRFFAPGVGIDEDPVTGSAHTTLIPYWSKRLGKIELNALQTSRRGGVLSCKLLGDRVEIGGEALTFMQGTIFI